MNILDIIEIVIIGGLALWMRYFIPTYIKKKAENAATKEDVKEITDKIESVKSDYTTKLEGIKSELHVGVLQRTQVNEKSYDSLISFFETSLRLIKEKLSQNLGDLGLGNDISTQLVEYQKSVEELFIKLTIDYHTLVLYHIDKQNLVSAAQKIFISSHSVRFAFKQHFGAVKISMVNESNAFISKDDRKYKIAVEENDIVMKAYYKDIVPCRQELEKAFNNYLEELNKYIVGLGKDAHLELLKIK